MTWPLAFTSGPPELPGLIAASVWMALMNAASPPSPLAVTGRFSALTMPVVTVPAQAERRADGDHRVADREVVGVAERAGPAVARRVTA